jgi:23S rRNA (guanosine2251-2'-O)-methyltransferase
MEAIYGINPISILLHNKHCGLEKIIVASGKYGTSLKEIIKLAHQKEIPVEFQQRSCLDDFAGCRDHQGVVGLRPAFVYSHIDDIINNHSKSFSHDLILILDSIMDPQNLGSIIRTACCWGANGVLIPTDRAASVTATVIKASAGSAEQIPIAQVTNLAQSIDYLKEKGFWIFGADAHEGQNLTGLDFNCHVVLVMGGEEKGIRPLIKKKCDFLLSIPLAGNFESLNVGVAAGIIQYEIFCQRQDTKIPQSPI